MKYQRRLLTIHKMFHKNECIPRIYLLRGEGGSGLMELNQVHRMTTVGLAEHVKSETDYRIQFACKHEDNKPEKGSITHPAKNFQTQMQMEDVTHETETATNTAPTRVKKRQNKNI